MRHRPFAFHSQTAFDPRPAFGPERIGIPGAHTPGNRIPGNRIPGKRIPGAALALFLGLGLALIPGTRDLHAQGTPTQLRVRAVSHDAKIIGSGVGGARITVRDANTGRVLAEGVQEGSTGSTRNIVVEPVARGATVFDTEGAGHFTTTLELEAPTTVEIVAEGPLGTAHATQRSSKTLLLIPGKHVLGEGVILVLNGFTVEVMSPAEGAVGAEGPLEVRARVTMLCGCPIEPGGLWDADGMEVTARIVRDGTVVAEAPLTFAGETSIFQGELSWDGVPSELQVLASDPDRANFGMATTPLGR